MYMLAVAVFVLQVVTLLVGATARLQQVAALLQQQTAAAAASSSHRAVLEIRLAQMRLAVQRVLQLQSLKPAQVAALLHRALNHPTPPAAAAAGAPSAASAGYTDDSSSAALATGLAAVLGTQSGQGPLGPDSAADGQAGLAGWQHWSASAAAAACAAGSSATWAETALLLQKEIVQQVEQLGSAALAEHAASSLAVQGTSSDTGSTSAAAAASGGSDPAASVRELLQQLPQVLDSVTRDAAAAEMAEVLQAIHKADFGYSDVDSFMRGHLYQCPNGHMYVIGECGGAMQRGRCPECGSTVGGAHHQLESSNSRADTGLLQRFGQAMRPGRP
jgi:hypothetical protein